MEAEHHIVHDAHGELLLVACHLWLAQSYGPRNHGCFNKNTQSRWLAWCAEGLHPICPTGSSCCAIHQVCLHIRTRSTGTQRQTTRHQKVTKIQGRYWECHHVKTSEEEHTYVEIVLNNELVNHVATPTQSQPMVPPPSSASPARPSQSRTDNHFEIVDLFYVLSHMYDLHQSIKTSIAQLSLPTPISYNGKGIGAMDASLYASTHTCLFDLWETPHISWCQEGWCILQCQKHKSIASVIQILVRFCDSEASLRGKHYRISWFWDFVGNVSNFGPKTKNKFSV